MVQVHGDPNEPSLGAGAAGAPCVTLGGSDEPTNEYGLALENLGKVFGGGGDVIACPLALISRRCAALRPLRDPLLDGHRPVVG